jgi:hypothetical protein
MNGRRRTFVWPRTGKEPLMGLIGFFGFAGLFMILLVFLMICLIPEILFVLTLQKALQRCSPQNRTISPGSAWLMLIPLFNLVWDFILVSQVSATLEREFRSRNIPVEPSPGKNVGLAWCILAAGAIIPFLGVLSFIGALVCWILYWVKIAGFSSTLAAPIAVSAPAPA